tara:strand:+ start:416 stop:841 length:426 start_codon:yes stop_codon:yes gene_type:complete
MSWDILFNKEEIMSVYTNYLWRDIKIHVLSMNIFNKLYKISFTLKNPSIDYEIWNNEDNKRIYEKAWFSKSFNKHLKNLADKEYIIFDEEVIKYLKRIKELILDKKTTTRFDHVRGNVENKEIMAQTIDRAIEIINGKDCA